MISVGADGAEASASPEEGGAWKEAECCVTEPDEDHLSAGGGGESDQTTIQQEDQRRHVWNER